MPQTAVARRRRFSVHGLSEPPGRGRQVEGASFEDAALHYLEETHPAAGADDAVSLIVEDCESGLRQCFRVDLASGRTEPCD